LHLEGIPGIYSFPLKCYLTGDLDKGGSSQSLPRHGLAFPSDSSIDIDTFKLRDDNSSGKAVLIAAGPILLPLLNLLADVLLLVAEEKSERSVPELAALGDVLLSDVAGKGELDCRYCKIVF
jgi:hypothetical protein